MTWKDLFESLASLADARPYTGQPEPLPQADARTYTGREGRRVADIRPAEPSRPVYLGR
jgi:hypothetical protein